MNKSEFFENVKNAVLMRIKDEDNSLDAAINEVIKGNGVIYHGLTFRGNDKVQPVIYLDEFFSKYADGIDFDEIVDTIANMYFLSRKNKDFDISVLASFEAAKEHIMVAVMNTELNEKLLNELPHRDFEDLSLYYKVVFDFKDNSGVGSVKISNSLMNTWNVSEEEIHSVTIANTLGKYKAVWKINRTSEADLRCGRHSRHSCAVRTCAAGSYFERMRTNVVCLRILSSL